MFIGLDGNEANVSKRVGSNVYAYELLRYFHAQAESKQQFQVYLKQNWETLLPNRTSHWQYRIFGPSFLWTQWRLPLDLYLDSHRPELFFTPGHYAPRFSPIPTVISIMDLAFLKFPQEFRYRDLGKLKTWTDYSVRKAAHIFAISQATKNDIMRAYGVDAAKITVTHLGIRPILEPQSDKDNSYQHIAAYFGITKPYFLYVGTLQPRKNLERLVEAFVNLKKQSKFNKLKLVIAGKKGWLYQTLLDKVEELQLNKEVVFTGYVSEYEKSELMQYAEALVLPSLYEGFGLPVAEAMSLGAPVVISKTSSLPEVGGEAAFYIEDPYSVASIEKSLAQVLQLSINRRMDMIARGKKQAGKFRWDECGKKTLEQLNRLVQDKLK